MAKNYFISQLFGRLSARGRFWFGVLFLGFVVGLIGFVGLLHQQLLIEVPASGGVLSEGLVGSPRFVNPLLATSDTDRDLAALIYSGLLRLTPEDKLIPDLAESYEISDNGLLYTFRLKPGLVWHDGEPLTAGDIAFTIGLAKDQTIKSPRLGQWEGVTVKTPNESTVEFTLREPYAGFLENATLGILPAHLWSKVEPEAFPFSPLNIDPVGSGPYRLTNIKGSKLGTKDAYQLKPFAHFALGRPKISGLWLKFYPNEEARLIAYERGEISSLPAPSPHSALAYADQGGTRLERVPLPRIFAVFFNSQRVPAFAEAKTRNELAAALNRQAIVSRVLSGFGTEIAGPSETPTAGKLDLSFSLATANIPELKSAAEIIKESWAAIGVEVSLQIFEPSDLNQNVIRPREYEALLFGEVVGRGGDLYPFWHSSQKLDPGLNITLYADTATDKLLEAARQEKDPEKRAEQNAKIAEIIAKEAPVIFLYRPDFLYLVPKTLRGLALPTMNFSAERFTNIYEWYLETDRVWPIFETLVK